MTLDSEKFRFFAKHEKFKMQIVFKFLLIKQIKFKLSWESIGSWNWFYFMFTMPSNALRRYSFSDGFINRGRIVVQIEQRIKRSQKPLFSFLSFSIKNATDSIDLLDSRWRKAKTRRPWTEFHSFFRLFASLDACLWNQKSIARRRTHKWHRRQ